MSEVLRELRDDIEFPKFESHESDLSSELRQVILVGLADFSDQPMQAQTFEGRRNLMDCFAEVFLKILVAKPLIAYSPRRMFSKRV